MTEFYGGTLHTDRIDPTGYTRLVVRRTTTYGFVASSEWIRFETPLPRATLHRSPLKWFGLAQWTKR